MPAVTETKITREGIAGGSIEAVRTTLNNLIDAVAMMMPGVLLSAPATKKGTTSAKTWRNEAFTFTFRGNPLAKAAAETAFTATTHDVAASKQAWFVLSIQAGGTLTITKAADQNIGTDVYPTAPDNEVIVGYVKIVTTAGGIWDATTDDLDAPGGPGNRVVSVTFLDNPALVKVGAIQ